MRKIAGKLRKTCKKITGFGGDLYTSAEEDFSRFFSFCNIGVSFWAVIHIFQQKKKSKNKIFL